MNYPKTVNKTKRNVSSLMNPSVNLLISQYFVFDANTNQQKSLHAYFMLFGISDGNKFKSLEHPLFNFAVL